MNELEVPNISFPCDYPIKVVCDTRAGLHEDVYEIVLKHDPSLTTDKVSQRTSRKGNFISISFMLRAVGQEQLEALFDDLKKLEAVRMVL